jgi:hypothetical protein
MKVRIVGLIFEPEIDNERCQLSGELADGYIELFGEMVPCKMSLLGPGTIGEEVDLPDHLIKT